MVKGKLNYIATYSCHLIGTFVFSNQEDGDQSDFMMSPTSPSGRSQHSLSPTPPPSNSSTASTSQSEPAHSSTSASVTSVKPSTSSGKPSAQAKISNTSSSRKRKAGDTVELAILESLRHVWDQPSLTTEEDEDGLFGRQLAATLRRFPSHQKAIAKLRIQQLLMDIEFGSDMSYDTTPSYNTF